MDGMRMFRQDTRLAIVSAGAGWGLCATLDNFVGPWAALGSGLALSALVVLVLVSGPRIEERTADREPFDVELRAYLKRRDFTLITNEMLASLKLGAQVHSSSLVSRDQAIFVNPEITRKLAEQHWPAPAPWRTVPDNTHAESCALRWRTASAFGCTCPSRLTEDGRS